MNTEQRVNDGTGRNGAHSALLLGQIYTNQFPDRRYLGINLHHLHTLDFDTYCTLFLSYTDSQSTKPRTGKSLHGNSSICRRVSGNGLLVQHISFQCGHVGRDAILPSGVVFLLTFVSVHVPFHDFILSNQTVEFHGK